MEWNSPSLHPNIWHRTKRKGNTTERPKECSNFWKSAIILKVPIVLSAAMFPNEKQNSEQTHRKQLCPWRQSWGRHRLTSEQHRSVTIPKWLTTPYLLLSFPHNNSFYFQVFPSENTECLQRMFHHMGGVPRVIRFTTWVQWSRKYEPRDKVI